MSAFDPKRTSEVAICCDAKRGSHIHFLTYGRTLLFGFLSNPRAKGGNSGGTAAFHFLPDSGSACWILCHLRFHSLRLRADNNAPTAGSMFRVHQWRRQCTFQVKVCSSCYWLALLRVGWPGSLWQVAGLVSSPISQLELLVLGSAPGCYCYWASALEAG